jgi:hypothetical protein
VAKGRGSDGRQVGVVEAARCERRFSRHQSAAKSRFGARKSVQSTPPRCRP